MGDALYRNYRPKSLNEVKGQDHITSTLKNALKTGRISHAYLFTGPHGVGKTSVARILAHEVNQIAYSDESIHLDIIEIDAASNRRIDEIRDLRERVRIAPAQAKYKVYIIDEVHMLTREAFNALLKTLEEPPAHCIFILATTEAHKLPDTIVSRTQRFEFKPISPVDATDHLGAIAKQEKIDISPEALEILAQWGNGSFRDSISYLDQLSSYGKKIEAEDVRNLLGLPAAAQIAKLINFVDKGDSKNTVSQLASMEQEGIKPALIAKEISTRLRARLGQQPITAQEVGFLNSLLDVSASHRPQERLELSLLEYATGQDTPAANKPTTAEVPQTTTPAEQTKNTSHKSEPQTSEHSKSIPAGFSLELWDEVVARSKSQAASIYTALRLAQPALQDNVLTLSFEFPLHKKKLDQAKNKLMVTKIIEDVSGSVVEVETQVDKQPKQQPAFPPAMETNEVSQISSIFGAAEVLEA